MKIDLSIVIPCYNESGNIPGLLKRLDEIVRGKPFEVILVNNGSLDPSAEVFAEHWKKLQHPEQFRLVTVPKNVGYGHGIRTGLAEARANVLAYTHADLQTDPADLGKAFSLFQEKSQGPTEYIVKGRRENRRKNEKLLSQGLDVIASVALQCQMEDINGQPKMFSRKFYEEYVKGGPDDLSLDVYLMAAALRSGRKVATVPVHFAERTQGQSSWNTTVLSKAKTISRFLRTIANVRTRLKSV